MCPTEPITDGELKRADPKVWLLSGMQLTMATHATGISTARYPNTLLGRSGDLVSGRIMGIRAVSMYINPRVQNSKGHIPTSRGRIRSRLIS